MSRCQDTIDPQRMLNYIKERKALPAAADVSVLNERYQFERRHALDMWYASQWVENSLQDEENKFGGLQELGRRWTCLTGDPLDKYIREVGATNRNVAGMIVRTWVNYWLPLQPGGELTYEQFRDTPFNRESLEVFGRPQSLNTPLQILDYVEHRAVPGTKTSVLNPKFGLKPPPKGQIPNLYWQARNLAKTIGIPGIWEMGEGWRKSTDKTKYLKEWAKEHDSTYDVVIILATVWYKYFLLGRNEGGSVDHAFPFPDAVGSAGGDKKDKGGSSESKKQGGASSNKRKNSEESSTVSASESSGESKDKGKIKEGGGSGKKRKLRKLSDIDSSKSQTRAEVSDSEEFGGEE